MAVPAAQRQAVLQRLCQGDEGLLAEVRSLLQSLESSGDFLEGWHASDVDLLQEAFGDWRTNNTGIAVAEDKHDRHFTVADETSPDGAVVDAVHASTAKTARLNNTSRDSDLGANDRWGSPELDDLVRELQDLRPEFQVQELVGRGGLGVVWRVFDQRLRRPLAVKFLWPRNPGSQTRRTSDSIQQMEREARAAAAVANENTVQVYEAGWLPSGVAFLVLEWVAGPTLQQVLQSQGLLPAKLAAEVTRQICLGLAAAHRLGLVHSDVKPANVLLQPRENPGDRPLADPTQMDNRMAELSLAEWRVKLADFGLASLCQSGSLGGAEREEKSADGTSPPPTRPKLGFAGTLAYASPDRVWQRQPLGPTDDVWSVGITLYQLLTGTLPFRGAPHAVARALQEAEVIRPSILEPSIPKDLESICLKALSPQREQRYAEGEAMADDLQRFLTGRPTLARPLPRWQAAYRWGKRHPQSATLAAALLLALLTLSVGALASRQIVWEQNQRLRQVQEQAENARLQRILVASPGNLKSLLESTQFHHALSAEILRKSISQPSIDRQAKLNGLIALAEIELLTEEDWSFLISAVIDASAQPAQCQNLLRALRQDSSEALGRLQQMFPTLTDTKSQIRVAIMAAHLGDFQWLERLAAPSAQPQARTELIHFWPRFSGPIEDMAAWLTANVSRDVQYALCMSLALSDPNTFPPKDTPQVLAGLHALQSQSSDAGVRAAADIASRNWSSPQRLAELPQHLLRQNTETSSLGFHLVRVPAGRHRLGRINQDVLHDDHQPHWVTLTHDYWIADREVSIHWYQFFLADPNYPADRKPLTQHRLPADQATSPTPAHPVQRVSWNDAALFCNWLSWRESLRPRYLMTRVAPATVSEEPSIGPQQSAALENSQPLLSQEWTVSIDPDADGYRLPTLAEWEAACRSGSESDFFYGDDFDLFPFYGRFSSARVVPTAACGTLLPNRHGLHETLGNVWEWCEDWYQPLGTESLTNPTGPTEPLDEFLGRTFAGGGVQTTSGEPIAGARGFAAVDSRFGNLGFRVARTCQSDSPTQVTSVFVANPSTATSDADLSR
jgi:serine/threonine protein kinase/formylglycine-generating enzyme required for sulfatase activity